MLSDLDATLEQLRFEHPAVIEINDYVTARLTETRSVADQTDAWVQTVTAWERREYRASVRTRSINSHSSQRCCVENSSASKTILRTTCNRSVVGTFRRP